MIQVIGLTGQADVAAHASRLTGATIVARLREPALDWLAGQFPIAVSFDQLFDERRPAEIVEAVVQTLRELEAEFSQIVYLVPGPGPVGDATVAALALTDGVALDIVPGALCPPEPGISVQIVDALELAIAEERWPFDAGLAPIEPTVATLVLNPHGASVVDFAARRVARVYGPDDGIDVDGHRYFRARDPLDATGSLSGLEHIVARLRRPDGCPWDREQTPETIVPMMLEEIEELRAAIAARDAENQAEEMGDLLLHLLLLGQMGREAGDFTFADVVRVVAAKMIRRHPHVFAGLEISSIDELLENWNAIKAAEKAGADPEMLEG